MKFKLDENMDVRLKNQLAAAGHDAHTVFDESLTSAPDESVWLAARNESRTLITQDRDFSNVMVYPVNDTPGIVVLRGPDTSFGIQRLLIDTMLAHLANESPLGLLWIVEPGRVRIHTPKA